MRYRPGLPREPSGTRDDDPRYYRPNLPSGGRGPYESVELGEDDGEEEEEGCGCGCAIVFLILIAVVVVLVMFFLERRDTLPVDTLLGLLAHGGLALGLVVLAFVPYVRFNLHGLLFGDILAVSRICRVTSSASTP